MYFDIDSGIRENEELTMLREQTHKFAVEVIRPAAKELDRMEPRKVAEKDSPYFDVMKQMKKMGYHRMQILKEHGGLELTPDEIHIINEELGWGSVGLTTAIGVDSIPPAMASLVGSPQLIEEVVRPWMEDTEGKYHGCWPVIEEAHGSDYIIGMSYPHPEEFGSKGFVTADRDGDGWVINGAKSYWTSSAPCANYAFLILNLPPHSSVADVGGCIVPLTLPGVTQGAPIDKHGLRDDPQGELAFDNVRIPEHYMLLAEPAFGRFAAKGVISSTSCGMSCMFTGLARAAFEEALKYTRDRVQGGKPLIEHDVTKLKLSDMFLKVETARYYTRVVLRHVTERNRALTFDQSTAHALSAQVYATSVAYEVAHQSRQLHGANGLTKDYLIEKLYRDATAGLMEDGSNEALSLEAAYSLLEEGRYTTE